MTDKEELAELKARVAELEAKAKPPEPAKPFVPEPYQRYDPAANMCMPRSAMEAMVAAEPRGFMSGVVHDNRAPTGRPGMIPSSQQPTSPRPSAGDGTGWGAATPIGPPPGLRYVDAQLDAQDARDRAELRERDANLKAMEKLSEQSEKLQTLIEQNKKLMEKIR